MDKERLKQWAQYAEIVSGVAVVVTLVFLIIEVRGNSDLIRANTFNRNIESLIDLRTEIAGNDASLAAIAGYWGIDDKEVLREQLLVVNLWSIYEKTFYSYQYDLVGEAEWERFQTRICGYRESRGEYWETNVSQFLSDEFRDFVVETCARD